MALTPISELPVKDRLTCTVWGPPKVGKTTFALSFPEPIYYFLWDSGGLDHHLTRVQETGKAVYVAAYDLSTILSPADATPAINEFAADFNAACKDVGTGSIVFDTASELWELFRLKMYGDIEKQFKAKGRDMPEKLPQRFYEKPNEDWRRMLRQVKDRTAASLVLVEREKPVYDASGQDTGRTARRGQSSNSYETQITLRMGVDLTPDGKVAGHHGIVEASALGDALVGMKFESPTYDMVVGVARSLQ